MTDYPTSIESLCPTIYSCASLDPVEVLVVVRLWAGWGGGGGSGEQPCGTSHKGILSSGWCEERSIYVRYGTTKKLLHSVISAVRTGKLKQIQHI